MVHPVNDLLSSHLDGLLVSNVGLELIECLLQTVIVALIEVGYNESVHVGLLFELFELGLDLTWFLVSMN